VYDVAVCQNEPIGRKDESGTRSATPSILLHFDLYNGRADTLGCRNDGLGISVK
jgi:hypothetical protein